MESDPFCFHLYLTTPDASQAPYVLRLAETFKQITSELVGSPRLYTFMNHAAPAVLHVCFRYAAGEGPLLQQVESAVKWMTAQPVCKMYRFNVATVRLAKEEMLTASDQVDPCGPRWNDTGALYSWTMPPALPADGAAFTTGELLTWVEFCTSGKGDLRTLFPGAVRHHVLEELQQRQPPASTYSAHDLVGGDLSAFYNLLKDIDASPVHEDDLFSNLLAFSDSLPFSAVAAAAAEELRVGDWVAYINPTKAWVVMCTQITGFDFSQPCPLKFQNLGHVDKVREEDLAFARFDPLSNSLASRLAPVSSYRLVY